MNHGRLKIVLGTSLLIGAAAIAVTLSQSPVAVARINTAQLRPIGQTYQPIAACQSNEVLPRETSAIRLRVESFFGPRVTVEMLDHGRVIAQGERGPGWTGGVVTMPVSPLSTARTGLDLCFKLFLNGDESNILLGEPTTGARAAYSHDARLPGRLRVEYLRPGRSSWWSLAPAVARRMGLGHAWAGTWSVLLVLLLMGGVTLVCGRLILRELE